MSDSNLDAPSEFAESAPNKGGDRKADTSAAKPRWTSGSRSLKRVDKVLEQVVRKLGLDRRLREQTLMNLWPHLLGEPWASKSRCLFIDSEHRLVVALADASTGQELSLMKPAILAKLRAAGRSLGVTIQGVRFDLKHFHGPADQETVQSLPGAGKPLPEPKDEDLFSVSLTPEERQQVEDLRNALSQQQGTESQAERIASLFDGRLRLRRWRQLSGYPACCACDEPVPMLHGDKRLCPTCFYRSM